MAPFSGDDAGVKLEALATVVSPDAHTSPISGERGVFFHVEVVEYSLPASARSLGEMVFGDVVRLAAAWAGEDVPISVIVRNVALGFADLRPRGTPLSVVPPELVPIVRRASGLGELCWREHVVRSGDRVRIRAVVERSATGLVVRDDLAQVTLEPTHPSPV